MNSRYYYISLLYISLLCLGYAGYYSDTKLLMTAILAAFGVASTAITVRVLEFFLAQTGGKSRPLTPVSLGIITATLFAGAIYTYFSSEQAAMPGAILGMAIYFLQTLIFTLTRKAK